MQSEPSLPGEPAGLCRCGHTGEVHTPRGRGYPCITQGCGCKWYTILSLGTGKTPRPPEAACAVLHQDAEGNTVPCSDEAPAEPECEHLHWEALGSLQLPDQRERLFRKCTDCGKRFTREVAEEPGPEACQHGEKLVSECPCTPLCECCPVQALPLPPPGGREYTPCVCGHIVPDHGELEPHVCLMCECPAYRTEPDFVLPPQPERRPPLSVAYSVAGGHAYEVYVPGDASVTALDGALIITHPDAQVLAITRVAPIKES